ncbi:B12-binding domain-containing protein [Desulfosarcina ovata]|uniref:Cobalamin-binding protein n=1 Tax=Desulfosarcina ovata subsp. ovata TaxID=2752305 RepID=A0A5K8A9F7_9BACT|nr:cobalamin-dependent protein [Desulfosarcina ovata]BBO89126.1 cobalamin-binding protein [Desulfosarcina ovata subsp. ovata]
MDKRETLIKAMKELEEDELFSCMEDLLASDSDRWMIMEWLQKGMGEVGKLFEQGEYFIADLIVAGTLFRKAISLFPPSVTLKKRNLPLGRILIGVMEGDIHDIGKDIVCQTLETGGFEVIDLGVDVSTEIFIEAIEKYHPDIVMLCGLMSFVVERMEQTIDKLTRLSLRNSFVVIVGGGCIDRTTSQDIGADYYGGQPIENMQLCKKIMDERKHNE